LVRNPFPRLAVPVENELNKLILYDPDNVTNELIDYVKCIFNEKSQGACAIVGNYGHGKTHMLLCIKKLATQHFRNALTIYVPSPGKKFAEIYRHVVSYVIEHKLAEKVADFLTDPLKKALNQIKHDDEHHFYIMQWLMADRIPSIIRLKLGLGPNIDDEKAVNFSVEVLSGLCNIGFRPIVILVDELEAITTIPSLAKLQYMNYLRRFIDNLPPATILIAALTPAGWTEIVNIHPALARRLSSRIVYLRNFKKQEVANLLQAYLEASNCSLKIQEIFDDEVLSLLHEISNGNPGEVLKLTSILFDEYLKCFCKININHAKKVLSAYA